MRAGKLRRRASLQRKVVTQGTYGEENVSWAEYALVWAAVEPLTGREFVAAQGQGEQAVVSVRIRVRHRDDVQAEDRVVVGARVYDIEAVVGDERNRELQLLSRELTD